MLTEEVPHHPAGGGEEEGAVAGTQVVVEAQPLQLLEQDAAVPVHDGLGQPGRAGGEQHPERVVEGHLLAGTRRRDGGPTITSAQPTPVGLGGRGPATATSAQARQPGDQLGDLAVAVELLAAVPVAVGGDEHRRLQLTEPVQRAAGAPKSGDTLAHTAPRLAVATIATIASGTLGRKDTTRSPRPIPRARRCGGRPHGPGG